MSSGEKELELLRRLAVAVEKFLWSQGDSFTERVAMQEAWNEYRALYPEEAP